MDPQKKLKIIEHFKKNVLAVMEIPQFKNSAVKRGDRKFAFSKIFLALHLLTFLSNGVSAQVQDSLPSLSKLKKLSLDELMNVEVTSISMRPEKLTEVASAIQVITNQDIHRSGALRLPEALRLASNLQIAQANSHDWSITARGFSGLPSAGGILANKLLVMVDGRSIYSPLFGGVYWDVQNVMLTNVDRVEVVSGPGGTLWGANAVNGVINVVTKSAKETQGVYVSGVGGSYLQDQAELQYGGRIGSNLFFRVYGQRFDQKGRNGSDSINAWNATQGGFRMDHSSTSNIFTFQGDFYGGAEKSLSRYSTTNGQNVLGRFTHLFSERSDLKVQLYFDRTHRKTPNTNNPFNYEINTYDLDLQYGFPIGDRQSILVGGGYRYMHDITNSPALDPPNRIMPLASGFVQDEIVCVPELLKLTLGSKFMHNVFTGFELQPSARIAFTPDKSHTIWTSVSRSVRTPSRFDVDIVTSPGVKLTPIKFKSEKVIAYELGYRVRPVDNLSFSFATFYNQYTDLRSLNTYSSTATPIIISNGQRAESWGFEFSGNYQATERWRLRGGYSYFKKKISATSAAVLPLSADFEGVDPEHQFTFQSILDLPRNLSLDMIARYVDVIRSTPPFPVSPAYFSFDTRLAWTFKYLEISLVGQNLLEKEHNETGLYTIPRSMYGKIICQF